MACFAKLMLKVCVNLNQIKCLIKLVNVHHLKITNIFDLLNKHFFNIIKSTFDTSYQILVKVFNYVGISDG